MRRDAALVGVVVRQRVVELDLLPAALAQMVDRQVDDDAIEPGEELCVAFERRKALVNLEERFLADVAGVVGVMNHPERDGVGAALVPDDQLAKGGRISAARIFDELPVVRLQARLRFVGSQGDRRRLGADYSEEDVEENQRKKRRWQGKKTGGQSLRPWGE